MRSFFKYFFAIILGGIVSAFVLMLLVVITISVIAASQGEEVTIKADTVLKLDLNGPIVERGIDDRLTQLLGPLSGNFEKKGLNQILESIKKAKRDTNIVGIYLQCGAIETGYATIEEIRSALLNFRKSGKFVVSYADVYAQKGYYLATAADKVYLLNVGAIQFQGLRVEKTYLKTLFSKIGIEFLSFRHGKFKSGIESFSSDKMSDEDRLQNKELLTGIWDHIVTQIAEARKLDKGAIDRFVNANTVLSDNKLFLENHLIDGLKYEDEVIEELKMRTRTLKDDALEAVNLRNYTKIEVPELNKELTMDKIALIYAEGGIDMGGSDGIISKELAKTIRKAREDKNIKAIVLRVNSPGGSAMGSDVIWREVLLAKMAKPVVVSMGDYAASGGYYIACVADTIFAQKTTITGSIGIYGQIPNMKGLKEKLGVTFDGVSTNDKSDFLVSSSSVTRAWTPEENLLFQNSIDRGYVSFVTKVADGRKLTFSAVDDIAQGRVWTGLAAQQVKLVDGIGGIDDAILAAKNRANLKNYRLVELPEQLSPIDQFFKNAGDEAKSLVSIQLFGVNTRDLDVIRAIRNQDRLQARLPYEVALY